jgi:hypothetical protein
VNPSWQSSHSQSTGIGQAGRLSIATSLACHGLERGLGCDMPAPNQEVITMLRKSWGRESSLSERLTDHLLIREVDAWCTGRPVELSSMLTRPVSTPLFCLLSHLIPPLLEDLSILTLKALSLSYHVG